MLHRLVRRIGFYFTVSIAAVSAMMAFFTCFYRYTENLSWLDAFYFTVITTRTIGFGDISPQTAAGKIGTILNALLPATIFLGTSLVVLETVMARMEFNWKRLRMKSNRNHTIIVAEVETLESVVEECELRGSPFVVISEVDYEDMPASLERRLNEKNFLKGDATDDETLRRAQVERAQAIIIARSDDNFNMYALVTAKSIAPGIHAVVQANRKKSEAKFHSVGADTILPAGAVLGRMLSEAAVNPVIHNFLLALHTHTQDPFFKEVPIAKSEAGHQARAFHPYAIAVHRNGKYLYDLQNLALEAGDSVLCLELKFENSQQA